MTQSNEAPFQAPEALLTPKFYDAALRTGSIALVHNVEQIAALGDFMKSETGKGFPAPVDQMDFAYYLDVGGYAPWKWDTHYTDADPGFQYLKGDAISKYYTETNMAGNRIAKTEIAARGTTILEVQTKDLEQSLAASLARTLTIPTHDEAKLAAGPGAWRKTIKHAFTKEGARDAFDAPHMFAHVGDKSVEAEAGRRFPTAVYLWRPNPGRRW